MPSLLLVRGKLSIIGFSLLDSYSASNSAFVIGKLKPFSDRAQPEDFAQALIAKTFDAAPAVHTCMAFHTIKQDRGEELRKLTTDQELAKASLPKLVGFLSPGQLSPVVVAGCGYAPLLVGISSQFGAELR